MDKEKWIETRLGNRDGNGENVVELWRNREL